MKVYMFRTVRL